MVEWFHQFAEKLSDSPLLQGILAAFMTLIMEDPTTITCGLLVADGRMAFMTALLGLSIGITTGDLGLYALGRWAGPLAFKLRLVSPKRLRRVRRWFNRNLITAVIVSRFVPGMRIPTFVGAGLFKCPFWKYLMTAIIASLMWTVFLMGLVIVIGQKVLPLLDHLKWPIAITLVAVFIFWQVKIARKQKRKDQEDMPSEEPAASLFELWPPWLFYFPVFLLLHDPCNSISRYNTSNCFKSVDLFWWVCSRIKESDSGFGT